MQPAAGTLQPAAHKRLAGGVIDVQYPMGLIRPDTYMGNAPAYPLGTYPSRYLTPRYPAETQWGRYLRAYIPRGVGT